jgi:histidine triad (HIT) family protein
MKKKIFIFISLIILICSAGFYIKSFTIKESAYCPFCDSKVIDYQKYYEDENILGLYSYRPLVEGHCLILPKRHIEKFEDLSKQEIEKIFFLIKKTHIAMQKIIDVNSYMILQKNGKEVGQSVPHLHFHYIPNKKNGSNFNFLFKFIIYPFKHKINPKQMHKMTSLISQNL